MPYSVLQWAPRKPMSSSKLLTAVVETHGGSSDSRLTALPSCLSLARSPANAGIIKASYKSWESLAFLQGPSISWCGAGLSTAMPLSCGTSARRWTFHTRPAVPREECSKPLPCKHHHTHQEVCMKTGWQHHEHPESQRSIPSVRKQGENKQQHK